MVLVNGYDNGLSDGPRRSVRYPFIRFHIRWQRPLATLHHRDLLLRQPIQLVRQRVNLLVRGGDLARTVLVNGYDNGLSDGPRRSVRYPFIRFHIR